ncbi:VWA domain-containing protein [Vibrio sp. PP-XX7]
MQPIINPTASRRRAIKAADLLKQWHEGVTGLVAYAADAYTISPVTTEDTATIQNLLPNLSPDIMPYQGANAVKGVKMAIQMMKDAGLNEGAIVLITDDIDQQEHDGIEQLIKGSHWHLAILGMGSLLVPQFLSKNGSLLQTTQGQTVIAKSGFDAMEIALAQVVDGTFISVQLTNQDVTTILRATKPGAFSTSSTLSKTNNKSKIVSTTATG